MNARKSVLFVLPSLGLGGAERQIVDLVNGLSTDSFKIHLLTFEKEVDLLPFLDRGKVTFYNYPRRHKYDLAPAREIAKVIDGENIDILHTTLQIALFYGSVGRLMARKKLRHVSAIHTTINRNAKCELFDRLLYVPIMHRCDRIITVCDSQKDHWLNKYPFLAERMVTVHNGIDAEHFTDDQGDEAKTALRRELGIRDSELVVGMAAGFRPEKNHEDVFAAFSRLARQGLPVKLLLVGDGERRQLLQAKAQDLGIDDQILWVGFTNEAKKYIGIFDVGVLFSYAVETFSMAILEMLAMGTPVVAADLGGTKEMIQDGVNGYLVRPRHVDALTDKLEVLLRDPQLRERFGIAARQAVLDNFTKDLMVEKTRRVLEEIYAG